MLTHPHADWLRRMYDVVKHLHVHVSSDYEAELTGHLAGSGPDKDKIISQLCVRPRCLMDASPERQFSHVAQAIAEALHSELPYRSHENKLCSSYFAGVLVYWFCSWSTHSIWTDHLGTALLVVTWRVCNSLDITLKLAVSALWNDFPPCLAINALSHHETVQSSLGKLPVAASRVLRLATGECNMNSCSDAVACLRSAADQYTIPEFHMHRWIDEIDTYLRSGHSS